LKRPERISSFSGVWSKMAKMELIRVESCALVHSTGIEKTPGHVVLPRVRGLAWHTQQLVLATELLSRLGLQESQDAQAGLHSQTDAHQKGEVSCTARRFTAQTQASQIRANLPAIAVRTARTEGALHPLLRVARRVSAHVHDKSHDAHEAGDGSHLRAEDPAKLHRQKAMKFRHMPHNNGTHC